MTVDVFSLPVFPAADVFPMMAPDELQELAADIKTNGLREPIQFAKIGDRTWLIDGRNRREACRIAKVDPSALDLGTLTEANAAAIVISANIHRRHMTKGQRAMAVAMIYPEPETGGRGKQGGAKQAAKVGGFSNDLLTRARTVLRFAPDLVQGVFSGSPTLESAYDAARTRKAAAENEESSMDRLRRLAPDLAELSPKGRMKLSEAALRPHYPDPVLRVCSANPNSRWAISCVELRKTYRSSLAV